MENQTKNCDYLLMSSKHIHNQCNAICFRNWKFSKPTILCNPSSIFESFDVSEKHDPCQLLSYVKNNNFCENHNCQKPLEICKYFLFMFLHRQKSTYFLFLYSGHCLRRLKSNSKSLFVCSLLIKPKKTRASGDQLNHL